MIVLLCAALAGCAPEWTSWSMMGSGDTAKRDRDLAECQYEAARTSGYDWVDATLQRAEVLNRCMSMRGYFRAS